MSEITIDNSKTTVNVDNIGNITFISNNGKICIIHMHPFDVEQIVKFLVKEGYNFA